MRFRSLFGRGRRHTEKDVLRDLAVEGADLSGVPAVPAVGEAEVHRFDNRIFIIGRWGHGPGVAAPDGADAHAIGGLIQRALAHSRAHPRQTFFDDRGPTTEEREAELAWEAFCRELAQSSPGRYSPEIRVQVKDLNDGVLRIGLAVPPKDGETVELQRDADAEQIGEVVLGLLAEAQPAWPTIRSAALVTDARGGFVVYPYHGIFAVGPVCRLETDVDEARLASAIRAALDRSTEDSAGDERGAFARALAEVGLEQADLAGGAMVSIRETTSGEIMVQAWEPSGGGWRPAETRETAIADDDALAVARVARAAVAQLPKRHREPGVETGAAFGYDTAWLAVRDSSLEQVADAIGLTARKRLPWKEGVQASHDDGVFVSPPTSGWIFAVGVGWFGREPDVAALSERLTTEVQYFATHSVVEAHTWARAVDGRHVRMLRYAGETGKVEEKGDVTQTEHDLGLAGLDDDAAAELISEETVVQVAQRWSLNPQLLGTTPTSGSIGIHGRLAKT